MTAGLVGCVGQAEDDDDYIEHVPDSDVEDTEEDDGLLEYDSDYHIANDFDYDFTGLPFVGVNLSGPEWGGISYWPDRQITNGYVSYPNHFRGWGMTTVRLPFLWERLQTELQGEFAERYWNYLKTTVYTLRKDRARVLIDVHNYARYPYNGEYVGSENGHTAADFADLWRRLAEEFKPYPEVMFGLMNEPNNMPTENWVEAANAAIAAIRETGAQNLIFVNGNAWSGAHSWNGSWYGTPNSQAMLDIVDPLGSDRTIFEVHQYLNHNSSDWGDCVCSEWEVNGGCTNETVGSYRMRGFTQWLRDNDKYGYVGEFGVQADPTCLAALDDLLNYFEANSDVYIGWAWWSAGVGCAEWQEATEPYCWGDDWDEDPNFVMPAQMQHLIDELASNPAVYVNP